MLQDRVEMVYHKFDGPSWGRIIKTRLEKKEGLKKLKKLKKKTVRETDE